jgi:hypothetical protein
LHEEARMYRDIATEGMISPDCSDALISIRARVDDDSRRLDALIRCNLIKSYATLAHDNEKFLAEMLGNIEFSSVTMDDFARGVFIDLIQEAEAELPAYCEGRLLERFEVPLEHDPNGPPTQEFAPLFQDKA